MHGLFLVLQYVVADFPDNMQPACMKPIKFNRYDKINNYYYFYKFFRADNGYYILDTVDNRYNNNKLIIIIYFIYLILGPILL